MAVKINILTDYNGAGSSKAIRELGKLEKAAAVAGDVGAEKMFALSSKITGVSSVAATVGASMTRSLTLPLAALGVMAYNLAAEYGNTMSQIREASGATSAEMDALGDAAKTMGVDIGYGATDAAEAILALSKSGMDAASISAGGLEASLYLAAAGGLELEAAAEATSQTLNTFGLQASDALSVANALAGGANASSASVDTLRQSLAQVGPGAVNAGLSLNETVGALAAFSDNGIQGSDAGTSLKTMLAKLVPQTDEAAQAMKDYNLEFVDSKGNFKDLTDIAQQLQDGLGDLSEAERSAALTRIFGSDATRAATVLMNEGSEGLAKYIAATEDSTAAERMAKAALAETLDVERAKAEMETALIEAGDALVPIVTEVAQVVGDAARAFSDLTPGQQETIVHMALVTAAAGPVLSILGKVGGTIGTVTKGMGLLKLAFGDGAAAAPKWARAIAGATTKVTGYTTATEGVTLATKALSVAQAAGVVGASYVVSQAEAAALGYEDVADAARVATDENTGFWENAKASLATNNIWGQTAKMVQGYKDLKAGIEGNTEAMAGAESGAYDMGVWIADATGKTNNMTAAVASSTWAVGNHSFAVDDLSYATGLYQAALVELADYQDANEAADIRLERAKIRAKEAQDRLTEAARIYGTESPEYAEAALDVREANLNLKDATEDAASAQGDLNIATSNFEGANKAVIDQWVAQLKRIKDGADSAARAIAGIETTGTGHLPFPYPAYGTGTFATSPHLAMVGDEPEVIIPLGDQAAAAKYLPILFDSLNMSGGSQYPATSGYGSSRSVSIAPGAISVQVVLQSGSQSEAVAAADTISDRLLSRLAMGV